MNLSEQELVRKPHGLLLGRKQERLDGRFGSDSVKFGIALSQRLRDSYFCAGEQVDELQRVDDGLSLEMIIRDDEGGIAGFRHVLDTRGPRIEFLLGVEV